MFVAGKWKNYDELESNLSMPELLLTLSSIREKDFNDKKFLAAMQGVDLESATQEDPIEAARARIAEKAAAENINSVPSQSSLFGIGYETI